MFDLPALTTTGQIEKIDIVLPKIVILKILLPIQIIEILG